MWLCLKKLWLFNWCLEMLVAGDKQDPETVNPSRAFKKFLFSQLLCGASKGFMKTFRAFIKPFEAPLRSVKIKI